MSNTDSLAKDLLCESVACGGRLQLDLTGDIDSTGVANKSGSAKQKTTV